MNKDMNNKEKALLVFLKQTKQGKYAEIDKVSLDYARLREKSEDTDSFTEAYYYNLT